MIPGLITDERPFVEHETTRLAKSCSGFEDTLASTTSIVDKCISILSVSTWRVAFSLRTSSQAEKLELVRGIIGTGGSRGFTAPLLSTSPDQNPISKLLDIKLINGKKFVARNTDRCFDEELDNIFNRDIEIALKISEHLLTRDQNPQDAAFVSQLEAIARDHIPLLSVASQRSNPPVWNWFTFQWLKDPTVLPRLMGAYSRGSPELCKTAESLLNIIGIEFKEFDGRQLLTFSE